MTLKTLIHPGRVHALVTLVTLVTLGAGALAARTPAAATPSANGAEVLWDRFGVPHIYARSEPGLGYAFGYAQMQSHANLLLRLYGQARGRGAEYWGQELVDSDKWTRTLGIPARAKVWYRSQPEAYRRYLDAFAAGINAYAREHRDQIADSLEVMLPVTAADVLAHGQRVILGTFVTSEGRVRASSRDWERQSAGSNAWAIAPSRTASGKAMLLANPHLPWSDLFTWYEAQLVAPGLDVYGATLVGSPGITIGFNEHLAWTHTVNTHDGQDFFELTVVDDGKSYRWDGGTRAFQIAVDTLRVKGENGVVRAEPFTLRSSVHGPVVAERPGKALALRIVGLEASGTALEWREMARARSLAEFERALKRMQLPMFTVMYADRDGRIMHLFGGLTPVRPRGDWAFWGGRVRGDSSSLLWTRYHTYSELPRVVDPPTGWLQNANDPPWTTTFPVALDPTKYPAYMAPRGMPFRPQRSAKLLDGVQRLTLDEMIERKHSTKMEVAERLLDDLLPLAKERGSELAKRAADVLAAWDRAADADSRGGVLFAAFHRELTRRSSGRSIFAKPWNEAEPLTTPDGLRDSTLAISALEAAAGDVERKYGALDVAWGAVYRLRRDSVDLPSNGGGSQLGIFRVTEHSEESDGKFAAVGGDSFVAAVEFTTPLRARALIGYGNSSQPGSAHRVDQLGFFAKKQLRTVWRTRADVEANLEAKQVLDVGR